MSTALHLRLRIHPVHQRIDRARLVKAQSYMALVDNQTVCKNVRCRKRFDISGVKTMAFL